MNILSVDPGSARVGFSVLSGSEFSELKLLDWGVFNFDSSAKAMNSNMNEVLEKLYFEFISLIHDHVITHLACEVVPAVAYMASKTKVSATSTALKCLGFQYELCWAELGARTVKKILTGNGNADKKEVREVVTMKFPKLKSTDAPPDAYDAVGVGVVAYQRDQWSIPRKNIYSDKNWNNNV